MRARKEFPRYRCLNLPYLSDRGDVATKIISKNKSLNLSEAEVKTLMQDLKNNSTLMKTISQNPENGIDAWKIFTDNKKAFCE